MKSQFKGRIFGCLSITAILFLGGCSGTTEPGTVAQDANLRVEILSSKIAEIDYQAKEGRVRLDVKPGKAVQEYLQVMIEVSNKSDSKKLNYSGWCEEGSFRKRAILTDEFGNTYSPKLHSSAIRMSNVEVVGHHTGSLYPGSSLTDVLVFEPPVDNATILTLQLPKAAYDELDLGTLTLRFTTESILKR